MIKSLLIFGILFSLRTQALVGLESLESKLVEVNQALLSLKEQTEAKETLYSSGWSEFYPTFNAVGGWAQNKTDELVTDQKGYVGYISGRYSLFNGLKDISVLNQKNIDLKLARIELESKKRELRLSLTETLSDMIGLHKLQAILEEEYKITQTQKQMAAKKVSAGLTGSVDNLEFDLRESEIQIERNQVDELHTEAHQKLIKLFGEDIADAELDRLDFNSADELVKITKQFDVKNNIEYQKTELARLRSQHDKSEIRSEFLPKLDFTLDIGRLTPSENTTMQFNEYKYGLALTVPLFSGFNTYYKTKSANSLILAAEKNKTQKNLDMTSDFNILKNKIAKLSELYKLNEIKYTNSQKYFDLTLAEYKRGVKNSPDLVGATERLFSSKKKKYEILKDLEILKVRLENLL